LSLRPHLFAIVSGDFVALLAGDFAALAGRGLPTLKEKDPFKTGFCQKSQKGRERPHGFLGDLPAVGDGHLVAHLLGDGPTVPRVTSGTWPRRKQGSGRDGKEKKQRLTSVVSGLALGDVLGGALGLVLGGAAFLKQKDGL
jgi:hypothetical protein